MRYRNGRILIASFLLVCCFHVPAFARDDCRDPLFICESAIRDKYIEICSNEEEVGRRWSHIQYRFGTTEHADLVYPADSNKGAASLFFSHVETKQGLYEVNVRFASGGYTYRLFSIADDKGDGAAGVDVYDARGKLISTVRCIERPTIFPSYLQRALACDLKNPHGKAACGDKPFRERAAR